MVAREPPFVIYPRYFPRRGVDHSITFYGSSRLPRSLVSTKVGAQGVRPLHCYGFLLQDNIPFPEVFRSFAPWPTLLPIYDRFS